MVDADRRINETYYKALFEQTNDAVFIIGLDHIYLDVNQKAADILGYQRNELVGMFVHQIVSLEEQNRNDPNISSPESELPVYERVFVRKDGSRLPVEISTSLVYREDGFPSHIQSIARDISFRKEYEGRLRKSETRNKAIVDALPDLIFRVDREGNFIDFSTNQKHPLHIEREAAIKLNILDMWTESVSNLLLLKIEKALETNELQILKFKLPDQDNTYEARLNLIEDNEVLGIVRDISEWVRLEQMKSDFINRASHELRTPLTTSLLMVDLIQEGGTQEEIKEFWQILSNELNRQKTLIDRLLIAGRLESNSLVFDPGPVDLLLVLEESALAVAPLAKEKGIRVDKKYPDQAQMVFGDVSGLQQVFINLINNAIKFSPKNSTVSIVVKPIADRVAIKISDQGIGIPETDLPNLFERFFRAKNVTIAEIPGSGVGLYIVKSIIEELGGEISVESDVEGGTTFVIMLRKVL